MIDIPVLRQYYLSSQGGDAMFDSMIVDALPELLIELEMLRGLTRENQSINDEIRTLREQLEVERPTGVCEICTNKAQAELVSLRIELAKAKGEIARLQGIINIRVDSESQYPGGQ